MSFNGFGENLDDMSFERLLELMEPRLLFYCVSWQHGLKDYDYDDIYQTPLDKTLENMEKQEITPQCL